MAGDFVAGFRHCDACLGVALERQANCPRGEFEIAFLKQSQQPPKAGAAAVFVSVFDEIVPGVDRR